MSDKEQIQFLVTQPNALSIFWDRVRLHQSQGLVPAGQVNPPPQPKKLKLLALALPAIIVDDHPTFRP